MIRIGGWLFADLLLGLSLPATPVAAESDKAEWATSAAERAAAVAAADAIIGAHQRRHAA